MRQWLTARKAGIEVVPNPDDPTSVLRPSRATTVGEKLEMKKRKQMSKVQTEGQKKIKKDIVDLQQQAAAEQQQRQVAAAVAAVAEQQQRP